AVASALRRAPGSAPFPSTTLFRSGDVSAVEGAHGARDRAEVASFPQLSGPKRRRDQRREVVGGGGPAGGQHGAVGGRYRGERSEDRKSTRLNSSHVKISYAVFCLK